MGYSITNKLEGIVYHVSNFITHSRKALKIYNRIREHHQRKNAVSHKFYPFKAFKEHADPYLGFMQCFDCGFAISDNNFLKQNIPLCSEHKAKILAGPKFNFHDDHDWVIREDINYLSTTWICTRCSSIAYYWFSTDGTEPVEWRWVVSYPRPDLSDADSTGEYSCKSLVMDEAMS